jgi:3-methyladenine DNA glycosylase/8-oxoguanine DNA glycosylase
MPGVRTPRSRAVIEAIVPLIIEQKVVGAEARRGYRRLVRTYGEPAPGTSDLLLPVAPDVLARIPYYSFHPFGIERKRADTVRRSCAHARWLETAADLPSLQAQRRLTAVRGVGRWTACEVARVAFGDPDAVPLGDYHLPHLVSWVLTGEPKGSDERMLELLEPYRGQRGSALRLIELSGMHPPRRGPRMPMRSIERH